MASWRDAHGRVLPIFLPTIAAISTGAHDVPGWYMQQTPPPSRPPRQPSPQPLPRRRTGAGVRLLIVALIGIFLILATALASVEAQRCREGLHAPVCRI